MADDLEHGESFWKVLKQIPMSLRAHLNQSTPCPATATTGCLGNSKTQDQHSAKKAQREANKKIEKQLQKAKQVHWPRAACCCWVLLQNLVRAPL